MHRRSQDAPLAARCQSVSHRADTGRRRRPRHTTRIFTVIRRRDQRMPSRTCGHSVDPTPVSPLTSLFLCTHRMMTSCSTYVCAVPVSREHMGIEHRSSRIAVARMRGRAQRIAEHRRSASRPPRTRRPDRGAATISGCITANTVLAS